MTEKKYANDLLEVLQCQILDASGQLAGILANADDDRIRATIAQLADLGQKLLAELHRRGKTYKMEEAKI